MVYAERGNKVKKIDESEIAKYAEKGFKIKDTQGNVLQETIPTDVASLRIAFKAHIDEIKALKAEIADLKAQLAKKTTVKATGSKLLDEVEADKADEVKEETVEEKPKRSRKKAD